MMCIVNEEMDELDDMATYQEEVTVMLSLIVKMLETIRELLEITKYL